MSYQGIFNVNEKEDSAYDSASPSVKSSIREREEDDHELFQKSQSMQMEDEIENEDPLMKDRSYNTENIETRVSDMANFYKYSKLQSTARNLPVHKFLGQMERESEDIKGLLQEGKKERRILKAKFSKTENDVSHCCNNLLSKVFTDIDLFRNDMLSIIQKNIKDTNMVNKELDVLKHEFQQSKKDTLVVNSLLKDGEHDLGLLSFTKEII